MVTEVHYDIRTSAPACRYQLVVISDEKDRYFNTAAVNPKIFVSCYKCNWRVTLNFNGVAVCSFAVQHPGVKSPVCRELYGPD